MNKISIAPGLHSRPQSSKKGFTLIELLVVITIIAVLAGLLFPAMGAVRNQARKASAKNDVTQIVNAIKAYNVEYSKYPITVTSGIAKYGADNNTLFNVLAPADPNNPGSLNSRGIRFLEIPDSKIRAANNTAKSGLDTSRVWRDPWGNPYGVWIDASYSGTVGKVTIAKQGKNASPYTSPNEVRMEVVAFSSGNPDSTTMDPVLSWQ